MTTSPRSSATDLPPPPAAMPGRQSLFIDFDGTLVPIAERPDQVIADGDLRALIHALNDRFEGRVAIVSGRSIDQLDEMFGRDAAAITLAGSHGAEIRRQGSLLRPARAAGLDQAVAELRAFAATHPATIIEIKSLGVALHFRQAPALEAEAVAAARTIAVRCGLAVQPGKMMVELHGAGCDKGGAIYSLMAGAPMRGSVPVVLGDDLTDEPALAAAADLGGFGVLVGPARATAARYGLSDVAAVRAWLWGAVR